MRLTSVNLAGRDRIDSYDAYDCDGAADNDDDDAMCRCCCYRKAA